MTLVESPPGGSTPSPTPPNLPGTPTQSGDLSPASATVSNERKVSTCNGPKPFPVRGL